MNLSLTKLPWYGQIGAFAVLAVAGIGAFIYYYDMPARVEIATRQEQLVVLKKDINRGLNTAKKLSEFLMDPLGIKTQFPGRPGRDPQRGHEQYARLAHKRGDIVHGIEQAHIGPDAQRRQVVLVRSPSGHGGKFGFGERVRQRQKNGKPLHGAGVHHSDQAVVESADIGPVRIVIEQRNRDVYCGNTGMLAEVIGHVVADPHHLVDGVREVLAGKTRKYVPVHEIRV